MGTTYSTAGQVAADEVGEALWIIPEPLQSPFMQLAHPLYGLFGSELQIHPPHHAIAQLDLLGDLIHRQTIIPRRGPNHPARGVEDTQEAGHEKGRWR